MSELRKQLEQGGREQREVRYPGDLAADLLNVQPMRLGYGHAARRGWLFWTNVGALGAVAATIAVVMWRTPTAYPPIRQEQTPIVVWTPPADDEFSVVPQLAGATLTPRADESAGEGIVPSGATAGMMPAMPSFPSLSEVMNSAESTGTESSTNNNS